jgi:hypothetical protein
MKTQAIPWLPVVFEQLPHGPEHPVLRFGREEYPENQRNPSKGRRRPPIFPAVGQKADENSPRTGNSNVGGHLERGLR